MSVMMDDFAMHPAYRGVKPMDTENIIINIRTQRDFDVLMRRLGERGYLASELIKERVWEKYKEDFCVRLDHRNKIVYHDRIGYYRRDYGRYPILTVNQYYSIYDKGFMPVNLNRNLINAIKGTQNAS